MVIKYCICNVFAEVNISIVYDIHNKNHWWISE